MTPEKNDVFRCEHDCAVTLCENDGYSVGIRKGVYVVLQPLRPSRMHENLVELFKIVNFAPFVVYNISIRMSHATFERAVDLDYLSYDEKTSLEIKLYHKLEDI